MIGSFVVYCTGGSPRGVSTKLPGNFAQPPRLQKMAFPRPVLHLNPISHTSYFRYLHFQNENKTKFPFGASEESDVEENLATKDFQWFNPVYPPLTLDKITNSSLYSNRQCLVELVCMTFRSRKEACPKVRKFLRRTQFSFVYVQSSGTNLFSHFPGPGPWSVTSTRFRQFYLFETVPKQHFNVYGW